MPRLRLFANLREIAGVSERSIDGATVGEVLERASSDYGEAFTTGVAHSRVWVNGDPASADTAVAADDEIAVLPPVSGGAMAVDVSFTTRLAVSTALLGALLIGNAVSLEAFVVTFVGVAAVWVWDLAGFALARGVPLNIYPMLFAVIAPAWGAYRWGFEGFAFAAMAGVAVVLVWALFDERFRQVESLSVTMLGTMLVATGAGPMVLLRGYGEDVVSAYIVVVIGALIAALLVTAFQYGSPRHPDRRRHRRCGRRRHLGRLVRAHLHLRPVRRRRHRGRPGHRLPAPFRPGPPRRSGSGLRRPPRRRHPRRRPLLHRHRAVHLTFALRPAVWCASGY
jgi:molybdopterin converting factor small subunit